MFDRVFREIAALKDIKLEEVVSLWNAGLFDTSKRRCLSIQVSSQTSNGKQSAGSLPSQSERDILLVHKTLDQWQLAPLPPATELKSLGLGQLYEYFAVSPRQTKE